MDRETRCPSLPAGTAESLAALEAVLQRIPAGNRGYAAAAVDIGHIADTITASARKAMRR